MGSVFVGLAIAAVCAAIIGKGIQNKRGGKGGCSCGGSCGGCSCSGLCHPGSHSDPAP